MRTRLATISAGIGALALAVTGIVAVGTQADAYTGSGPGGAPSWVAGDALRKGAVVLYDAAGNQIAGGTDIQAIASYVGTTGAAPRSGATKATAYLAARPSRRGRRARSSSSTRRVRPSRTAPAV